MAVGITSGFFANRRAELQILGLVVAVFSYSGLQVLDSAEAQCVGASCTTSGTGTASTTTGTGGTASFIPPSLSTSGSTASVYSPTASTSSSLVSSSSISSSLGGILGGLGNVAKKIFGSVTLFIPNSSLHVWGINVTTATNADVQYQACNILGLAAQTDLNPDGGRLSALVMVVSGLIAIVAGATGSYKTALATLVVGIGASILETIIKFFFGDICDPTIGVAGPGIP